MRNTKYSHWLQHLFLVLILLSALIGAMSSAVFGAGPGNNTVEIFIEGLLLDQMDKPMAKEEVSVTVFTGKYDQDIEETAVTDSNGRFSLHLEVSQTPYENSGLDCVTLQIRAAFDPDVESVDYIPGSPAEASQPSEIEAWAEEDNYTGPILLYHSLRLQEPEEGEEPIFDGLSVRIGSDTDPCIFQLHGKASQISETLVTVNHLDAVTGSTLEEEETYTLENLQGAVVAAAPKAPEGMAPILVMVDGEIAEEAGPESPVEEVAVEWIPPDDGPGSQDDEPQEIKVIYYYHKDRDGDGIPDHEVKEQFVTTDGSDVPGHNEQVTVYAHQQNYIEDPPKVEEYTYLAMEKKEDFSLAAPVSETGITADTLYRYIYENQNDKGGGISTGGGNGKTEENGGEENPSEPDPMPDEKSEELETKEPPGPNEIEEGPPEQKQEPEAPDENPPPMVSTDAQTGSPQQASSQQTEEVMEEEPPLKTPRTVTFVKQSLQKQVEPGEEVSYAFTGFENPHEGEVSGFTILDRPDKGLDFLSAELPAFAQGQGVTLDVTCVTNLRSERYLLKDHPADKQVTVKTPDLLTDEHITEIYVYMGRVPPDFGAGEQITMTFRVWEDPPEERLHNLGLFYYKDMEGLAVEHTSGSGEGEQGSIWVQAGDQLSSGRGHVDKELLEAGSSVRSGPNRKQILKYMSLALMMVLLMTAIGFAGRNFSSKS